MRAGRVEAALISDHCVAGKTRAKVSYWKNKSARQEEDEIKLKSELADAKHKKRKEQRMKSYCKTCYKKDKDLKTQLQHTAKVVSLY